jgi:hypothetical protein
MLFDSLPLDSDAVSSPYAIEWDVLRRDHCGMGFEADGARLIHINDATVPETQYLRS